ncbi:MAG TPA: hypothetical protein VFC52_00060, partial [Solirubrobacterales bacterium]|nr:hypothetical protein [Solirubrobacterales bacterium]
SLPGFNRIAGPLLRTPAQGADTAAWLATSPAVSRRAAPAAGVIWHDRRPRPAHRLRSTRETASERAQLFEECLARTAD